MKIINIIICEECAKETRMDSNCIDVIYINNGSNYIGHNEGNIKTGKFDVKRKIYGYFCNIDCLFNYINHGKGIL